jgi:hypothetical protein
MLVRPASQPCRRGRRRATRSPQSERTCTNSPSAFGTESKVSRSFPRPASETNQCSPERHSRDQLRNVERMVRRPCPAAQKPSAAKRRAKRQSNCAVVWSQSCRRASAILGAFHASTSEAERSEEPPCGLHGHSVRASTPFLYRGRHSAKKRGSSSQKTRTSFSEKQD